MSAVSGREDTIVVRYEQLRAMVLTRHEWVETTGNLGLALFVRHGMAAWMKASLSYNQDMESKAEEKRKTDDLLPVGLQSELTMLLVNMALGHHQEVM